MLFTKSKNCCADPKVSKDTKSVQLNVGQISVTVERHSDSADLHSPVICNPNQIHTKIEQVLPLPDMSFSFQSLLPDPFLP